MADELTPQEQEAALLAAFLDLRTGTEAELRALVTQLVAGELTPAAFGEQFLTILQGAHAQAGYLGRQLAGVLDPFGEDDTAFGVAQAAAEAAFLNGFVADLEAGRYRNAAGELSEKAIAARAAMYAYSLLGSVNEAWVMTMPPETTLIYWHLGDSEHCPDCPDLETGSPYTPESLPTVPGAGDTECGGRCRCWLSTGSGYTGLNLSEAEE
jgi:hypothetical protein